MEESSEAHMETDVSSTTEDVPETQAVTGSNGNVEMMVVVELVKEDEVNAKNVKTQSANDDTVPTVADKSPQKDSQPEDTIAKSPTKIGELQMSPVQSESSLISPNKPVQHSTQQSIVADSSSKIETSKPDNEKEASEKSLTKPPEMEKTEQTSPVKEIQPLDTTTTPVKELDEPDKSNVNDKANLDPTKQEENVKSSTVIPIDITIERDASNDSQMETNSDTSEKEHNRSISRELKSLINSAKESKIISECTQLTSKTRKSRVALDSSNMSLNSSIEADKILGARRSSNNSQMSNCSEKSDKAVLKRSMRSQNPEFVNKVKQFLSSVTGKGQKDDDMTDDEEENKSHNKNYDSISSTSTPKKTKVEGVLSRPHKLRSDPYCWRCHWAIEQPANEKAHVPMMCTVCPRSFHFKCLSSVERSKIVTDKNWVCPECLVVLHAESSETRSPAMKKISLGMLCELLKYALERMMDLNGVEPFMSPVDRDAFPDYDKYVVHPMDLSVMKGNIAEGLYGSTEAFLADAQWILHNSIIFNTLQSKLTGGARGLVRYCRAEMGEIEACPECYAAAHARRPTWFTDVCSTPHVLLWAKLKGFPYWPAKGMSVSPAGLVDVRFFGAHDRAWVPAKDCFLYSEKDPNNFRTKRQDILDSMQEAEQHIRNISRKYGKFVYPPFKTQFEPSKLNDQLKMMIPSFEGEVRAPVKEKPSASPNVTKEKSRSNSKSSKSSVNDSDISEAEDPLTAPSPHAMEGVETAKDNDSITEKNKTMEVDVSQTSEANSTDSSRKRRRSELEEAVITILDNSTAEKRKRVEEDKGDDQESTSQEPSSSEEVGIKPNEQPEKDKGGLESENKGKDDETSKAPNEVPSSSTAKDKPAPTKEKTDKNITVTPVKVITGSKSSKHTPKANTPRTGTPNDNKNNDRSPFINKTSTPKDVKSMPPKQKPKTDKCSTEKLKNKDEKTKSEKRRSSKSNRSLNGSNAAKSEKVSSDKKAEKNGEASNSNKDKAIENNKTAKDKEADKEKSVSDKDASLTVANSPKSAKDRILFDDDTSLAIIARKTTKNNVVTSNATGLPTISSVRSLSTVAQNSNTTVTKSTAAPKTIEVTIEAHPDSSIFTPTSTDNIRNVKDAACKLQKLRNESEPLVGRVGVRAFARMTSPEKPTNDDVEVEIKAEPIDLDDADRQTEKMDLMNAFKLRPVNPSTSLREVRINKVVISPLNRRSLEVRPRAKKTFPQPKKPEDGQLNGKNSMVYIPIQPPMTQAPVRPARPITNGPIVTPVPVTRPIAPVNSGIANNIVNTNTPPLVPISSSHSSPPSTSSASTSVSTPIQVPTVGQVPTTVHTVPLMTSVNGQWMFSLQPIMSVGGVDTTPSPPLVNGLSERVPSILPAQSPALPALLTTTTATNNNRPSTDTASTTPGELPRLQQRPSLINPLDPGAPVGAVPPPSTAGPLTAKLNQNAVKLTDFFRTLLEDSLEKLDEPSTQVATLRLQLEQLRWRHQQQLEEIKHNHELTMAEMRASFEKEKCRAVSEARRLAQLDLETAVKQAKAKQWCANCSQEAQFYCCWNTSYCDYPCQRAHWSQHFAVCTQQRAQDGSNGNNDGSSPPESRLQPQPDNLPKSSAVPALTVGGKLAPSRVYTQEQPGAQKTSIIVSMVEDSNGTHTMKCLGTYSATKPAAPVQPSAQHSPVIINKQIMSNEETNKKVVTSGGYLIVGAAAGNASVVTPSRRTHTIQYYT